ncbi:MAG: hypothetical protein GF405_00465 [Candidatus Eisenbacteria bacterium]|nr:hypothetical protein [Candidatus Eisenbacteria bacterium]
MKLTTITAILLLMTAGAATALDAAGVAADTWAAAAVATPPLNDETTGDGPFVTTPPIPFTLDALEQRITASLPPYWKIVEADRGRAPIGWDGPENGLYVMAEDTRTRFFHPNGFHYFSFYRVWIMPSNWEGEMRKTPYVTDSSPAFLLGVDDEFVAFYHTAGGNVWPEGPKALCGALGTDDLCHTSTSRRVIDLEFEKRLVSGGDERLSLTRDRIIGLTGGDNAIYLEYIFTRADERAMPELSALTDSIIIDVFEAFPEIDSLYLRRCTSDTFTDTIVSR